MGKSGRIIVFITALAVALFAYVMIASQMSARLVSTDVISASERRDVFDALKDALKNGDMASNQYGQIEGDAENYAFVTYTARLAGYCPLSAEWAVLSLAPAEGDVVLVQGSPESAVPFGSTTVSATLLTRAENATQPRHMWVEYYVLGRALNAAVRAPS